MHTIQYLFFSLLLALMSVLIYKYLLKHKHLDENGDSIYTSQTIIGLWSLVVTFAICSVFCLLLALLEHY